MQIKLNGTGPGGTRTIELPDGGDLSALARAAGIDPANYRFAVAGLRASGLATPLRDGDVVDASPLKNENA